MARCCSDFTRTELVRRGVAEAGRGLPSIEPGMPVPAGSGLSRRSFIARSLGMALAVYGGAALKPQAWLEGIEAAAAAGPRRVLVSIFLDGGADALSMLFPADDPLYRKYRPRLALAPDAGTPFPRLVIAGPDLAPLDPAGIPHAVTPGEVVGERRG